MEGVVKWFKAEKGFGFIVHEGKDVFVHKTSCFGKYIPKEGDKVTFDTEKGPKGICAVDVVKA